MNKLLYCMAMLATLATPACSQRMWYEGLKQSHRNECNKAPPSAREECLKAVDNDSYDEYERKRQEEMKKQVRPD